MGNLFANIPVPAANGPGTAVDVSTMGKTKSIVCGGVFDATVNLEFATDAAAAVWAPLATFQQSGNLTIELAAHWLRANVAQYKSGAANVDVGASDAGTTLAQLPGVGTSVDVSTLPLFKTVVAPGSFKGNIELSEDGVSWAQIWSMQNGGGQSRPVVGKFARVHNGSGEDVWIGGAADDSGGSGSASSLLSLYGNGDNGDHTTAGDEAWSAVDAPAGSPTLPVGATIEAAFFQDLTISAGDVVTVGGLSNDATKKAIVVFVDGTLTIGAGGSINANGADAVDSGFAVGAFGHGRNALPGCADGGDGAAGVGGASAGAAGSPGGDQPAYSWATMSAITSGGASTGVVRAGGPSTPSPTVSWPYSLSQAIGVAALIYAIGGGGGGGSGGAASVNDNSGSGGGGGSTLVIFARRIVAPAGSIQCKGGKGGAGFSAEPGVNQNAGGGRGGDGGTIIIVTDETDLTGICDTSGGIGGLPSEGGGNQGANGNPGAIIAINPMLGPIPV